MIVNESLNPIVSNFLAAAPPPPPDAASPDPPPPAPIANAVILVLVLLLVEVIVGATLVCVVVILEVAVQPLADVTVTVYVPGAVMLAIADDPRLLLHE
jgi:hypothetical protein